MAENPTRFPHGFNNVEATAAFNKFGLPDPSKWHVFFHDFDRFEEDLWTITTVQAGSGSATRALLNEFGGALQLTNDNAISDSEFLQWSGDGDGTTETFLFEGGRQSYFKTRLKVNTATSSAWMVGLIDTDTTPLIGTDGIWFLSGNNNQIALLVRRGPDDDGRGNIATVLADEYMELTFYYDGAQRVMGWFNENVVADFYVSPSVLPDEQTVTVTFGHQNSAAAASVFTVDYILSAKER